MKCMEEKSDMALKKLKRQQYKRQIDMYNVKSYLQIESISYLNQIELENGDCTNLQGYNQRNRSQSNHIQSYRKLIRFKNADFNNKQSVEILQKTPWGELQVGDIVLLQRDEYSPADLLILDMWESKCMVDTSFIDDQSENSLRFAPILTSISKNSSIKGNLTEYRRILSGRIDLKKTDNISSFCGYISLKKDPISEKFGERNLLQKYTQVKYTDWLVGIVILCGNDSLTYRRHSFEAQDKQRSKPSYFRKDWDLQSMIQILMIFFFSLIVIILRISMNCYKSIPFKGQMIPIAIDFVLTFPSYSSIVNQIFFICIHIFYYEKNSIYFLNYLTSFCQISGNSHVIFNSLRIQHRQKNNVSSICLKDRFFKLHDINPKTTQKIIKVLGSKENGTLSDLSQINSPASAFLRPLNFKKLPSNSPKLPNLLKVSHSQKETLKPILPHHQKNASDPAPELGYNEVLCQSEENIPNRKSAKHSLTRIMELDSKNFIVEEISKKNICPEIKLLSSIALQDSNQSQDHIKNSKKQALEEQDKSTESINQSLMHCSEDKNDFFPLNLKMIGHEMKKNITLSQLNHHDNSFSPVFCSQDARIYLDEQPNSSQRQLIQADPQTAKFKQTNSSMINNSNNFLNRGENNLGVEANPLMMNISFAPTKDPSPNQSESSPFSKTNNSHLDDLKKQLKLREREDNSQNTSQLSKSDSTSLIVEIAQGSSTEQSRSMNQSGYIKQQQNQAHLIQNIKIAQTGQAQKKTLNDDFLEFEMESSSDEDSSNHTNLQNGGLNQREERSHSLENETKISRRYSDFTATVQKDLEDKKYQSIVHPPNDQKQQNLNSILEKECESQEDEDDQSQLKAKQIVNQPKSRLRKNRSFTGKPQNQENDKMNSNFLLVESADHERLVSSNDDHLKSKEKNSKKLMETQEEKFKKRLSVSTMLPQSFNSFKQTDLIRPLNSKSTGVFEGLQGFQNAVKDKNQNIKKLLYAMVLCHESKSKVDREKSGSNIGCIHLDEITKYILEFTKSHGIEFECSCSILERQYYIVQIEGQRKMVQVLFKFHFQNSSKTIIVMQQGSEIFLLIRQISTNIPAYLINSISVDKKQKLELLLQNLKEQGEKILIYTKKVLSEEQLAKFQNSIRLKISSKEVEDSIEQMIQSSENENDIPELQGFIGNHIICQFSIHPTLFKLSGLKEVSDNNTKEMIKELRRLNQKIWVLTSDRQENVIESCYNYKILNSTKTKVVDFSSTNFDELIYKTRNHLEAMKKVFSGRLNQKEALGFLQNVGDSTQLNGNGAIQNYKQINIATPTGNKVDKKSSFAEGNNQIRKLQTLTSSNLPHLPPLKKTLTSYRRGSQMVEKDASSEENEETYSVVISGESLNVIRQNEYLWNHFCLIVFFAKSVVGYEMSDEQKSFLGQTIVDKFKPQQQRVVNIMSTINDSERLNYDQISLYLQSKSNIHQQSNSIISQHSHAIAKDSESFVNMLFRDSRLQMETLEELKYLGVHRSYLLSISILIWNISSCACNFSLFTPLQAIFLHGIQFLATSLYYVKRKREKFHQDGKSQGQAIRAFYSKFSYFKEQVPILNLKIIVSAIIDSVIIFAFFSNIYDLEDGSDLDISTSANLIQWGIYLTSFVKVFDLQFFKLDSSFLLYTLASVSIITLEQLLKYDQEIIPLLKSLTEGLYFFNFFLFLCFLTVKNIAESRLLSAQPLSIIGLAKYVKLEKKSIFKSKYQSNEGSTTIIPIQQLSHKNDASNNQSSPIIQNEHPLNPSAQKVNKMKNESPKVNIQSLKNIKPTVSPSVEVSQLETESQDSLESLIFSSFSSQTISKQNPAQVIRSIFKDKEMDIILSSMLMQGDINLNQTQMSKFTLNFQIKEIELLFEKSWELIIKHSNQIFYVIHFVAFDIGFEILVLSKVTNEFSSSGGSYVISYAITSSAIFLLTALTLTKQYQKNMILIISIFIAIVRSLKYTLLSSFKSILTYPIELVMHIAVASSCFRFTHTHLLIQGIILFIIYIILTETSVKYWNLETFMEAIGYISSSSEGNSGALPFIRSSFYLSYLIIFALFINQKYNMNLTLRNNYLSEHNLFKATMKVKDILSILLPKFIREKIETMRQGQYKVAEKQDEVVIVFCDICNFDDIIFNEKTGIVRILDKLYRQFDLACSQNGLQKIETVLLCIIESTNQLLLFIQVGKTYLAAAGITDVEKLLKAEGRFQNVTPAKRALLFAFDLQKIVKGSRVFLASNKNIIIKVGIHLGPAISGVIGYHKPQFSLIGDTVNTTSRVCSTGLSDMITISNEVYQKVYFQSNSFKFVERQVEAKGKGTMITYQVFDRKTYKAPSSPIQKNQNFEKNEIQDEPTKEKQTSDYFDQLRSLSQSKNKPILPKNVFNFEQKVINNQEPSSKKNEGALSPTKRDLPSPRKRVLSRKSMQTMIFKNISEFETKENKSKSEHQKPNLPFLNLNVGINSINSYDNIPSSKKRSSQFYAQSPKVNPQLLRKGGRMLKKSSSFTIVDVKPHFQGESRPSLFNKENKFEDLLSPQSPSKNELINKIEGEFLVKVEIEPHVIQMRDLRLPSEKLQQIQQLYQDQHPNDKKNEDPNNNGSHLKQNLMLGLCFNKHKKSQEQNKLQTEFVKQIQSQQIKDAIIQNGSIFLYFLIKVVIIANFTSNIKNLSVSSNISVQLAIFASVNAVLLFVTGVAFRKLYTILNWQTFRILVAFVYFLLLLFTLLQGIDLDSYMKTVTSQNLIVNRNISLSSVVSVVLPTLVIYGLETELIFLVFTSLKCFHFIEKVAGLIIQLIFYFIYAIKCRELEGQIPFFLLLVGIIHLRIQQKQTQNEVRSFNNMKTLESKKDELDQLLNNLLPSHVLKQFLDSMKKEIPLVCEELDDVTLLFADIAGFTKYSSSTDPIVVVNMLRKLFTDFDDHCLMQNVFKLYTIGDCYVCFGLTNMKDRNPAQEAHNVVRFAFDMINIINNVRQYTDCNLQMRIGVHTGKLYGGIVGTEIVRYDVYGVDVIIANKMESNGENGRVMVSEATKKLLEDNFPDQFDYDFKETVHIKQANKNIDGYLIEQFQEVTEMDGEQGYQDEEEEEQDEQDQESSNKQFEQEIKEEVEEEHQDEE